MSHRFDAQKGSILVDTKLYSTRGVSELTFVLDTGAEMTVIDAKFLRELGITVKNGFERICLVTGSGYELASKIVLPKLKALGKTRSNFEIAYYNFPKSVGADGVLGLDFRGLELNINFRSGQITLK